MPTQRSANPTQKDLLNRLTNIRKKLSSLRQEEDKISQKLSQGFGQELSKYLTIAGAIDIDFNVLLGGMLEVISIAKANTSKPCPELSRRMEVWQKSGLMFRRQQRRGQTSIVEENIIHSESKNKSRTHISSQGDDKNANPYKQ